MELRVPARKVTLITFPADDAVFNERVAELVRGPEDAGEPSDGVALAQRLTAALRIVHPDVATSWRASIAGFGDRVLYVFRDGTAASTLGGDDWIDAASCARVVTDPAGAYLDANDAAVELFGVRRDDIIGSRAGRFTEPDARITDADALWRALQKRGKLHSLATVRRAGGELVAVEFITLRDGDGPGRNATYIRPLGRTRPTIDDEARTLVAEVGGLQRDAKELLETLPPMSPDHETALRLVLGLRFAHDRLLQTKQSTRAMIDSSARQVRTARQTLDDLRARRRRD